ncbi:putative NRPS-like enzyme [Aspergillus carlsbadensis]|nr:putative NRPS-like enzyme [Aspergillus carlsbadensis]
MFPDERARTDDHVLHAELAQIRAQLASSSPIVRNRHTKGCYDSSDPPADSDVPLHTINDILLHRIPYPPDAPLVGYSQSSHGVRDYAFYTAKDLDEFSNGAAKALKDSGLPKYSDPVENRVAAIIGPSNLDYVVSLFALSRLGYAILLLSTRLSTEAYTNLLAKTGCSHIVYSSATGKAVAEIQNAVPDINVISIPEFAIYSESRVESKMGFIIHSSGSTGLPKPIFQTHAACIANYSTSNSYRALLTLPLYHNHGLCTFFRSLLKAKPIAIYNANLRLTGKNILEVMGVFEPESFHGVPYILKLLSEVDGGVEALAKCQQVLFGGSSRPDDLGNYLVDHGVRLISHYGATELGQMMTSDRPVGDKLWNYVRPLKGAQPYLQMEELEDGSYECIALDGLPAKVSSNCDDPPNSFRTRDTFLKHPAISNAWKYLGRIDDRVTLVNGEKVLPFPIEHRIRQSKFVKDNLVFGVGKPLPGLFVVPSAECEGLSKDEILNLIWPDMESANNNAEAFSQISRDMVIILGVGCSYPATDKGTMIRNRSYMNFSDLIEVAYQDLENGIANSEQKLALGLAELEDHLLNVFRKDLGYLRLDLTSVFYDAGVDSLQAIKARGLIKKDIDFGSAELGHNVAHLYSLRTGEQQHEEDESAVMSELIDKYSTFRAREITEEVILLTGTTGSLGAHILSRLMQKKRVRKVYCLVRASDPSNALDRVLSNLASKSLQWSEDLGLPPSIITELRTSLTKVIHSAWAVNFTLGVKSFEAQHIKGVHSLINLCLSSERTSPAQFYFCSSISVAAGSPLPATIAEAPIPELAHAQNMGYARSKLVAERIVQTAAEKTDMIAKVLRVGQIVGDTVHGKWSATETIPLMLQTAHTLKALPKLDETPSWLLVDVVADAVLDLADLNKSGSASSVAVKGFSYDPQTVYHVQNARTFGWTEDLLPALRSAGLDFEVLPKREWVQRLRDGEQDPKKNPAVKLLDFFAEKYDNNNMGRAGLVLGMRKSEAASRALNGVELIESGLIKKFVDALRSEW